MCDSIDDDFFENSWVSLADILCQPKGTDKPKVTVALLKKIIEANGVRTYDQWGELILATDGDKQELTSKARAYKLLATFYAELMDLEELPPGVHPAQDPDRWFDYGSPLHKFGWPEEEAPDFAAWIAKSLQKSKELSSTAKKDTNPDDWKEQARQIADELFDIDTNAGARDSLNGYSKRVMELMQERKIHGPRGHFTNHKTIMRDALQSDKWWCKKKP